MTTTDTAAQAAIGAAARELHLPTVRAEATRLADIAVRQHHTHLGFLAEVLSAANKPTDPSHRQPGPTFTTNNGAKDLDDTHGELGPGGVPVLD